MAETWYQTPPPPTRSRWWRIAVAVLVVLLVAVFVASRIQLNYYAISPGQAQPVEPLVKVPPAHAHPSKGTVLLTDVDLSQVSLLQWVPDHLSGDTQVVPSSQILGPATSSAELTDQGYLEMAQSQSAAKTLALRRLGYAVPERDAGAQLFAVAPGSPAGRAGLQVAQTVTAADGTPTPTSCALIGALHSMRPGDSVDLTVEQTTVTPNAVVRPGPTVQRTVRLGPAAKGAPASGCPGVSGPSPVYLGVELSTLQDFTYPFPIAVDTTDIGGPSAGLAMTLGILQKLSAGNLTGGHVIAATGTIDTSGDVGDVGGVPQKTIAVERAGASVFFVPADEVGDARSKATPGLEIFPVTTLDQVLADLAHLGGDVPPAPTTSG